ncbi:MAG: DNA repair protein RecO [Deltaproteobacteria bacterium]|nr:DNA repair protein RecO [Deltaproteobacteria bacterium]
MITSRSEALVLGLSDYGEGHRLVRLFDRETGLVKAFAPAARKSRKRYGGTLEPMAHLEVVLTRRPGRDLPSLDEARVLHLRLTLREHLERIFLGTYLVELTGMILREDQPQAALFDLLVAALDGLDGKEEGREGILSPWGRIAMDHAILESYGAAPHLAACASCGRTPEAERSRYSVREGGLCCQQCQPHWLPDDRTLLRRTRQALLALAGAGVSAELLARAAGLPADDLEAIEEARRALEDTLEALLGRAPKSRALLDATLR